MKGKWILILWLCLGVASCQPSVPIGFGDLNTVAKSTLIINYPASMQNGEIKVNENEKLGGEEQFFNPDGTLLKFSRFDKHGNHYFIDTRYYNNDGLETLTKTRIFVNNRNVVSVNRLIKEKDSIYTYLMYDEYKPHKKDTLTMVINAHDRTIYQKGELLRKNTFNEKGQLLEERYYVNNEVSIRIKKTYEDKLLMQTHMWTTNSDTVALEQYKYLQFDEQGNWTERAYYSGGELKQVTKRAVRY